MMNRARNNLIRFLSAFALLTLGADAALAARGFTRSSYSENGAVSHQHMLMDFSGHYVRDTKPDGLSDTAARFSIGGMFSEWVGLDLQGLFKAKSASYLIGADIRLVPVEWLFVKVGVGGYSDRSTRTFQTTPLAGTGIKADITDMWYFLTEMSYFQAAGRSNVAVGTGLGVVF